MKYEIVQFENGKYAIRRQHKFLFWTWYEYKGRVFWHSPSDRSKEVLEAFCGFDLSSCEYELAELLKENSKFDESKIKVIK